MSDVMKSSTPGWAAGDRKGSVKTSAEAGEKVNLSEKDGEKIARHLKQRSEKAIHAIQKNVDAEVHRVVHALHGRHRHGGFFGEESKAARAKGRKRPAQKG